MSGTRRGSHASAAAAAAALALLAPVSAAAVDAAAKCQAMKAKAAGRYAACLLNAEAETVKKGTPPDPVKCANRLTKRWARAEIDAAGACPTTNDLHVTSLVIEYAKSLIGDSLKFRQSVVSCGGPTSTYPVCNGLCPPGLQCGPVGGQFPPQFCVCQAIPRIVFVTRNVITPSELGGLAGADAICQSRAQLAGLAGTYKAWLSDSTSSPSTRFTHALSPYVRTDGKLVALNWNDLVDGSLLGPIGVDEYQALPLEPPEGIPVVTNTLPDGTRLPPDPCNNWTLGGDPIPTVGLHTASNFAWTHAGPFYQCDYPHRLYCFQQ